MKFYQSTSRLIIGTVVKLMLICYFAYSPYTLVPSSLSKIPFLAWSLILALILILILVIFMQAYSSLKSFIEVTDEGIKIYEYWPFHPVDNSADITTPFEQMQHVTINQGPLARILGYGNIKINTRDDLLTFLWLKGPEEFRRILEEKRPGIIQGRLVVPLPSGKEFHGLDGTLVVGNDGVTISYNKLAQMAGADPAQKTIPYDQIKTVQLKQPTIASGFIQIVTMGQQIANDVFKRDLENTIHFDRFAFLDGPLSFMEAARLINEKITGQKSATNSLDELEKQG